MINNLEIREVDSFFNLKGRLIICGIDSLDNFIRVSLNKLYKKEELNGIILRLENKLEIMIMKTPLIISFWENNEMYDLIKPKKELIFKVIKQNLILKQL